LIEKKRTMQPGYLGAVQSSGSRLRFPVQATSCTRALRKLPARHCRRRVELVGRGRTGGHATDSSWRIRDGPVFLVVRFHVSRARLPNRSRFAWISRGPGPGPQAHHKHSVPRGRLRRLSRSRPMHAGARTLSAATRNPPVVRRRLPRISSIRWETSRLDSSSCGGVGWPSS
jgi:hypothetical protein